MNLYLMQGHLTYGVCSLGANHYQLSTKLSQNDVVYVPPNSCVAQSP